MSRKEMTVDEWQGEARRRFGDDPKDWRFKCVRCGHGQSIRDFQDIGVKEPDRYVNFSCIGRFKAGVGCDWTLGGLFHIHTLEVVSPDGHRSATFEFADAPQANGPRQADPLEGSP